MNYATKHFSPIHHFADTLRPSSSDRAWAAFFAFMSVACFSLTLFLSLYDAGRWKFASSVLMTIFIDAALWFALIKRNTSSFSLKFSFVYAWILKFMPLMVCLTLPLDKDYLFPWGDYILDNPIQSALGGMVFTVAIAFTYYITSCLKAYHVPAPSLGKLAHAAGPRLEYFLIFAALIVFSKWITSLSVSNPIFYIFRILAAMMAFAPFFVGFTAFRFKKAAIIWLIVLVLGVAGSSVTGGRGLAFYPILYFLFGFVIGLPTWGKRLRWGFFVLAPVAILLLFIGVRIGVVRDTVGRASITQALSGDSIMERIDDNTVSAVVSERGGPAYKAFRRLTTWPSYVIPAMTPDPVPFRGFSDFPAQVRGAFELGVIALVKEDYRGAFYFDNIHLQPYGFAVHIGADMRKVSNVEFGVHVESFTRGGWLASLSFSLLAFFMLFHFEKALRDRLLYRNPSLFFMMIIVLCLFGTSTFIRSSLPESLRMMVLQGGFGLIVFYLFDRFLSEVMGITLKAKRFPAKVRI